MLVKEASDFRYNQYSESEKKAKAFAHDILMQCQVKGFTDCEVDAVLSHLGRELLELRQAKSYVTAFRMEFQIEQCPFENRNAKPYGTD